MTLYYFERKALMPISKAMQAFNACFPFRVPRLVFCSDGWIENLPPVHEEHLVLFLQLASIRLGSAPQ